MKQANSDFPYKSTLSLVPLIDFWRGFLGSGGAMSDPILSAVEAELENAPELLEPILDMAVFEKHRVLVENLMSLVFPPAFREQDYGAAFVPFQSETIYATPSFKRLWPTQDCMDFGIVASTGPEHWYLGRIMKACAIILETFYDMSLPLDFPLIVTVKDPDTQLERHLSITFDPRFVRVRKTGSMRKLSNEEKDWMISMGDDPERWLQIFPPEHFLFEGFGVCRAVDVTDQEVLSSLKRDLIEKASIFSCEGFQRLHQRLRTYLRQPDLIMDLAAFQDDQVLILNPEHKMEKGCIFSDSEHRFKDEFAGSFFAEVVEKGEQKLIRDLTNYPNKTPLELHMLEKGIRSVFAAPLYYQDRLLGTFSVKSPQPDAFSVLDSIKLQEIMPLFSMAVNRGMEELDHRVQAIIKEKCTAIHPSVEWRFRRAALNYMQADSGAATELEPILFPNVYALYGVTDIRDSSQYRNEALQADLADQFKMVRAIIRAAHKEKPLPILDALNHRISKHLADVESRLSSGDEITKADFIRREIEPVLDHLVEAVPHMRNRILEYRNALDPVLGALHRKRKDFEESIRRINETISAYLDEEEETSQSFFPHYFEKMKTDGVDHSIYIGASMVENLKFDMLYLRNLRLWQFMVMCGVAWRTGELKAVNRIPLEAAHLILVQDAPLSIRFRPDERRFDVDGAYDIRHEIIKKRIDKAMVKDGSERLTQPGKIAIVYSHRREMLEYLKYIDYLEDQDYLEKGVEKLDLQDLQGVSGLRALRVTVNMEAARKRPFVIPEAIQEVVKGI